MAKKKVQPEVVCITAKIPLTVRQWDMMQKHGKDCFRKIDIREVEDIDWDGHFGRFLFFTVPTMETMHYYADLMISAINTRR